MYRFQVVSSEVKNIFNFSVRRPFLGAVIFYIFYMVLVALLCGVLSGLICAIFYTDAKTFQEGFSVGLFWGPRLAVILGGFVAICVLTVRRLWISPVALILFLVSLPLFFLGGTFVGMLPVAVLTMLKNNEDKASSIAEEDNFLSEQNGN